MAKKQSAKEECEFLKELDAYNKKFEKRYWSSRGVPRKVPEGRVIVHNFVNAMYIDQPHGIVASVFGHS